MDTSPPPDTVAEVPPKRKSRPRRVLIAISLVLFGLLAASLIYPAFPRVAERAPRTKAINTVKQLSLACRAYAADFGGVYPPSLDVLYPDYLKVPDLLEAEDANGRKIPMIYHSGFTDTGNSRAPLIEYPVLLNGRKIVGYCGGHVSELLPE